MTQECKFLRSEPVNSMGASGREVLSAGAKTALSGALAAGLLVHAQSASAQDSSTVETELLSALELNKTQDLDFGDIVAPGSGRIDLTAEAEATCTPNNEIQHFGVCQAAAFEGRGSFGQNITITVPPNRRFELTGPDRNLRIRRVDVGDATGLNFQGRTNNVYRYQITDSAGEFDFHIGARVLIRNNQAPGIYSGTFNISLEYQ